MGRGPRVRMEERARIVAALADGMKDAEAARRFERSRPTIESIRRQAFGPSRKRPEKPKGKTGVVMAAPPIAEAPAPKPHAITVRASATPWTKPEAPTVDVTVPLPVGVLQAVARKVQNGEGIARCAARLLEEALSKQRVPA